MNKVTIIPESGLVMIDGIGFDGLNMAGIDPSIHAVQWYGSHGEIEYKSHAEVGAAGETVIAKPSNKPISSLDEFSNVIAEWEAAKFAADNPPPPPEPTPEEIQKQYLSAVDTRMTAIANTRGYDSVESASKYIGNTRNETWAAEGEALRDWAIDVYEACYAILAQVMAGEIPMPSIDELFGMLPYMVWPDGEIVPMREGDAQA